eukprot:CAMPEP_0198221922 /NCGR_PEP_ID=MMETSP1445-20131203/85878_1 /TAXON_ID=36898 /ORGANISM="Pyramimonas sp., Strain CCMP2087" /LENGTH=196 /DNA_ID=CAMNT_0043900249 /DNA_START=281 /DNA_END=868 /DNA_ORIENTATION=-
MGRRRRRQEETNDDNEGGSGASSPKTTCLREGAVLEFKVSHTLEAEPGSTPGFFNTRMQLNRDLTVCSLSAFLAQRDLDLPPPACLDAFAASGVLGLRWALEVPKVTQKALAVTLNDADPQCLQLAAANAIANSLAVLNSSTIPLGATPCAEGEATKQAKVEHTSLPSSSASIFVQSNVPRSSPTDERTAPPTDAS